jgi:hypothetical protein
VTKERRFRWKEDQRIVSIVAAPPGWYALTRKDKADAVEGKLESIFDYAWVEPVAVFALVEVIEREEVSDGEDEDGDPVWKTTGRTEMDAANAGGPARSDPYWLHTEVVPLAWHSGEQHFPDSGELDDLGYSLVVGPNTDLHAPWVLEQFKPRPGEAEAEQAEGDAGA